MEMVLSYLASEFEMLQRRQTFACLIFYSKMCSPVGAQERAIGQLPPSLLRKGFSSVENESDRFG